MFATAWTNVARCAGDRANAAYAAACASSSDRRKLLDLQQRELDTCRAARDLRDLHLTRWGQGVG